MNPKYTAVVDDIRCQILHGRLKPWHRIPTRDQLVSKYNTSRATIQKAMDELLRDGFIVANGKGGTFVADAPPNLNSIAVLFPASGSDSPAWDNMWNGFISQKRIFEERYGRTFLFYHVGMNDCSELDQLVGDANGGKLSGVIMPFPPYESLRHVLQNIPVPQVAITREELKLINTVWLDYDSFFRLSMEYLEFRGCRRVAVLANDKLPLDYINNLSAMSKEMGIEIPERLIQGCAIDKYAQPWITRLVRLMMSSNSTDKVDGLVIANENIIDAVIVGLQQEMLTVGKDIMLAVHTNLPSTRHKVYDMQHVGFSIHSMLDACINCLYKKNKTEIIHNHMVNAEFDK